MRSCALYAILSLWLQLSEGGIFLRSNQPEIEQRVPLFAPDRCGENELLYPTNDEEWICDCGPGYIYYQKKDACFAPYRQGPCQKGYFLVYNQTLLSTRCVKNPCQDGFVKYKDTCYELGKPNGPCPPISKGGGIFDVNATTLKVECLTGTESLSLANTPKRCAPGSRNDLNGNCREIY